MKKIGIYGGTFDPIHHGHLILAREAVESLGLEKLIFIPAARSPHKLSITPSAAEVRMEMLRAAVDGEQTLGVDGIELRRPPPSYTIDTVESLRGKNADTNFYYLVGEDNIPRLKTWHRFEELARIVEFVVLARSAAQTPHPFAEIRRRVDISGTEIRKRVARGLSVRYLVPAAVDEIIRSRQLYREMEK